MGVMPGALLMMARRASSDHRVSRSLRFNVADTPSLSRTPGGAGNRRVAKFRARVKLGTLGTKRVIFSAGTSSIDELYFDTDNKLKLAIAGTVVLASTRVFRDPTAWLHEVGFDLDTTQATASNRASLRVKGAAVSSYSTDSRSSITLNLQTNIANTVIQYVGRNNSGNYFSGFIAEPLLIDGAGTLSGYASGDDCAAPSVSAYGTNGFYLKLDDNSNTTAATLGKDSSGNGNNLTPSGFSVAAGTGNDSLIDSPTSYDQAGEPRGNYPTMCELNSSDPGTLTDGGMTHTVATGVGTASTFCMVSGKWYAEATLVSGAAVIGLQVPTQLNMMDTYPGQDADGNGGIGYRSSNGTLYNDGVNAAYGATYTSGDIIGIEVDRTNLTAEFFKNGASQGLIAIGASSSAWRFASGSVSGAGVIAWNFGQRPFSRTPTTGYLSPCSLNFESFADPTENFAGKSYTGSGSSQAFTDTGFAPDLLLTCSASAVKKIAFDSTRSKGLEMSSTAAEATISGLTLDAAGFTVPANTSGVSTTGQEHRALLAKKGSGRLDIVTWTGNGAANRLIGHSAGGTPRLVIAKRTDSTGDWFVHHSVMSTGANAFTKLNGSGVAESTSSSPFGTGSFTSTQIMVTHNATNSLNASGATYIAYIFVATTGACRGYGYQGNGLADGPCIGTGFLPLIVLYAKYTVAGADTYLHPNLQENPSGDAFVMGAASAKATGRDIDFLSNGFKIRDTAADLNSSGRNVWFMAFGLKSGPDVRAQ